MITVSFYNTSLSTQLGFLDININKMRIGLGMAALGRPGYINLQRNDHLSSRTIQGMQSQANLVISELFNQCKSLTYGDGDDNIPWLDCARSYGLSEKFVGEYLRSNNIKPNDVYVSSKW